ncbi:flagellar biosynthetic protein FliO [Sandaracinobacteroides hominis]|uniref:flagellar biosynthetic protein FliO n=1 Tax=Sandaracinobacteroides hominis TaxID=2780086 RepID=UPI0018F74271|nr:flagellar biosynthetic protein FliO [Sandaracinobacteroides hominis]
MLGEFLARLAIALPLVCAAAFVSLLAVKRGWIRLPSFTRRPSLPATAQPLDLVCVKSLTPTARLAVVRFDGRDHLVGVSGQHIVLLTTAQPQSGEAPICTA